MREMLRHFVESARRWTASGATRNARLEVDRTTRSIVDLERQLDRVGPPTPRRAA